MSEKKCNCGFWGMPWTPAMGWECTIGCPVHDVAPVPQPEGERPEALNQ